MGDLTTRSGKAHPLGTTVKENGVNFSLYSQHATAVTLLIFDHPNDELPSREIQLDPIENTTFHFWHIFVEGLKPGVGYAYRVDGPRDKTEGHRFNPNKVLVDTYAKGISFERWNRGDACHEGDNVRTCLRGVVIDPDTYDWEGDEPLNNPVEETVIYEMHVGGFTSNPNSGVKNRGTFLGVIEKIPYLKKLGANGCRTTPNL